MTQSERLYHAAATLLLQADQLDAHQIELGRSLVAYFEFHGLPFVMVQPMSALMSKHPALFQKAPADGQ